MTQAIATVEKKLVADKPTLETLMANESFQESLRTVLPKHLTPERVMKMALVAASRQPLLYKCTQASILQSLMKSAELGLDCSGTLGRAYLVPYYNSNAKAYEAQFIPGYQGLIDLARRSGEIARIESRVVYENDVFVVEYGLDQKLVHRPAMSDRGSVTCVYAIAEMTDGSRQIEVMTLEEVEKIRNRSKAKDNGPWKTDFSEMARKTVIRRISKYLPLSTELAKALEADDEQFDAFVGQVDSQAKSGVEGVKERLHIVTPEEAVTVDVEPEPEASQPAPTEPRSTETEPVEADPLEGLRSNVQAAYDELPKRVQADVMAGKPVIGKMTEEELTNLLAEIEKVRD